MSDILFAKRLLLAKLGVGTYPADPIPVVATDSILTRDLTFNPFQGATETLDYDKPQLGAGKEIYTGPHAAVSFKVDLSGSGTAGTPPAWGKLLRMCGYAETINAGVDVVYNLVSSAFGYGSLYFNHDGELHKLLGVRGNAMFNFSKEASPYIEFNFLGLWDQTPTAVAPGTPDFSDFTSPIPVNKANTPTFTVDGYAANAESLSVDSGQQVEYRNVIGQERVLITDRSASGSMSLEKTALADKDFFAIVRAHQIIDINLIHGVTAGNIVELDIKSQLKMSPDTNSQGLAVVPFDLRLVPTDAGNDEFTLTVR